MTSHGDPPRPAGLVRAGRPARAAQDRAGRGGAGRGGARQGSAARPQSATPAERLPIARVAVDISLAHLDRPFDYLVAEADSAAAQPGVRVRVRFAGRLVDGFILQRAEVSDHDGRLAFLHRVISPEVVLSPAIARLSRAVADRYAGSMADVLRLAVPPRHGRTENEPDAGSDGAVQGRGPGGAAPGGGVLNGGGPEGGGLDPVDGAPGGRAPGGVGDGALSGGGPEGGGLDPVDGGPDGATPSGRVPGGVGGGALSGGGPEDGGLDPVDGGPGSAAPGGRVQGGVGDSGDGGLSGVAAGGAGEIAASAGDGTVINTVINISRGWGAYTAGEAFARAVAERRAARAIWCALPGEDWPDRLAELAAMARAAGRGALLLVPDARDLARVEAALAARIPAGEYVTLSADQGPAERYRRFLAVSRGRARIVAGTRAAVFAPVRDLALIAVFDDGDDLHAEPRAPYPHAREVAMMRSAQEAAALLIGGFARTAEAQLLVESGWARSIDAPRATVRARMPRIEAAGDDYAVGADSPAARARLTPAAFAAARQVLDGGAPVLVQVPRAGYLPSLACADCGRPARCRRCSGPLAVPRGARTVSCRWCGVAAPRWACPACASTRIRGAVTGAVRTAEEIGRAFPGVRLITSAGGRVQRRVGAGPAIVVATPGAEPVGNYGAALLLDGGLLLSRPDLRAAEEALRRWMAAAALVRPAVAGGHVIIGADIAIPAAQALIRWDPVTQAAAELAARRELGFPPAVAMASIEGGEAAVAAAVDALALPASAAVLGPVPVWRRGRAEAGGRSAGRDGTGAAAGDGGLAASARTAGPRGQGGGGRGDGPAGRDGLVGRGGLAGRGGLVDRDARAGRDGLAGRDARAGSEIRPAGRDGDDTWGDAAGSEIRPAGRDGDDTWGDAAGNAEGDYVRVLIRVPPADRKQLAAALRVLAAARSIRKDSAPLRIEIDPVELG